MSEDEDRGRVTPVVSPSGGYPLLQAMAGEMADRLEDVRTFESVHLRRQLRALAAIMATWGRSNQPTEDERKALVDELVEAAKKANAMLPERK